MSEAHGEHAKPHNVAFANGRHVEVVYRVEGVPRRLFRTVDEALRHAQGLPPVGPGPGDTKAEPSAA